MLIACIECGRHVSDSVKKCPHCAGNPKGEECRLCGRQVAQSKARSFFFSDWRGQTAHPHYHAACLDHFKNEYLNLKHSMWNCPECHNDLAQGITQDSLLPIPLRSSREAKEPKLCPFCGYKLRAFEQVGSCTRCKLPIYRGLHAFLEGHGPLWRSDGRWEETCHFRHHIPLCLEYLTRRGFKTDEQEYRYKYYALNGELEREIAPRKNPAPLNKGNGCIVLLALLPLVSLVISICLYLAS